MWIFSKNGYLMNFFLTYKQSLQIKIFQGKHYFFLAMLPAIKITMNWCVATLKPIFAFHCLFTDSGFRSRCFREHKEKLLKRILKDLVERTEENKIVRETLQSFNVKYVINWKAQAWNEVKSATLSKLWGKIIDTQNIEYNVKSKEVTGKILDLAIKSNI